MVTHSNVVTATEDVILSRRDSNNQEGLRRITASNGVKGFLFDLNLDVDQESKIQSFGSVHNEYSKVFTEQSSDPPYGMFLTAGGHSTSTLPVGFFQYEGGAMFRYEVSSPEYKSLGRPATRLKSGTAVVTVNFDSKTGNLRAIGSTGISTFRDRSEGLAELNIYFDSIDQNGNISGSGVFTASGDTFDTDYYHSNTDSQGNRIDPTDNRFGWIVKEAKPFTPINEASVFQGALFGPNGEEVSGIAMGNEHQVGISVVK